ncbi:MAG: class I SAM-dependent methyltransferase [Thermoflexales bacterium]|nr:class I SAM-dependent methyltransferase [Thermoflexales bacterium]
MQRDGVNPFIREDLWVQSENSTVALIQKYSRPGDKILDVGVGLGRLLSHCPNLQKYGMDISLGYLEVAQSKGIEVCYALIEDMPYEGKTFGIVVATDVLEHVLDLNLCVAKILSVLVEDGVLIVRVPYREDLSQYVSPNYPYKYVHLRSFDESSLCLLFERVFQCKVIETTMTGHVPSMSSLKYTYPFFPRGYYVLERCFAMLKMIYEPLYNTLLKNLYNAIEINLVVKKRSADPVAS